MSPSPWCCEGGRGRRRKGTRLDTRCVWDWGEGLRAGAALRAEAALLLTLPDSRRLLPVPSVSRGAPRQHWAQRGHGEEVLCSCSRPFSTCWLLPLPPACPLPPGPHVPASPALRSPRLCAPCEQLAQGGLEVPAARNAQTLRAAGHWRRPAWTEIQSQNKVGNEMSSLKHAVKNQTPTENPKGVENDLRTSRTVQGIPATGDCGGEGRWRVARGRTEHQRTVAVRGHARIPWMESATEHWPPDADEVGAQNPGLLDRAGPCLASQGRTGPQECR